MNHQDRTNARPHRSPHGATQEGTHEGTQAGTHEGTQERAYEAAAALRKVTAGVVDTSSIIYMIKAGFMDRLAFELDLTTPSAAAEETGWPRLPVRISTVQPALTADDAVLALAVQRGSPVISEDRELLMRAGAAGIRYFNSLMMLNLLADRGRCDVGEYALFRDRLREIGRYSAEVLAFADGVAAAMGVPGERDADDPGS